MAKEYSYIKQRYGLSFAFRDRVRHTVTGMTGMVVREDLSHARCAAFCRAMAGKAGE